VDAEPQARDRTPDRRATFSESENTGIRTTLDGSARIALKTLPAFDRFVFIEKDAAGCASLEGLRSEFPHHKDRIRIIQDDANAALQRLGEWNNKSNRAVLFLDPYGMDVEWQTIEVIAATKAIDLWVLIPLEPSRSQDRDQHRQLSPEGPALMAQNSSIEWIEATWNPVTGCTKISAGCKHCYAERMALRLRAIGQPNYRNGFELTLQPQMLDVPLRWKKSRTIFVNSMSDLFHDDVPEEFILRVFDVMRRASQHRLQVLTKRASRLSRLDAVIDWPRNVWMGVSVEDDRQRSRIDSLRESSAHVRFLSLEPLLGPLHRLDLANIDWVIGGGESGPGSRPMQAAWVTDLRDQCISACVPFFFKHWGGRNKKRAGRVLEGRLWSQMPNQRGRSTPSIVGA